MSYRERFKESTHPEMLELPNTREEAENYLAYLLNKTTDDVHKRFELFISQKNISWQELYEKLLYNELNLFDPYVI